MAIPDDTERLTTDFPTLCADLVLGPPMHLHAPIACLPSEEDNLAQNQLGDRSRVTEWGVEDSDSVLGSIVQVDLVCPNTKAANYQ